MKIKCDWCGSWINDFDQVCPNCGGVNNNYNRHANGVPQTIEELKAWAKELTFRWRTCGPLSERITRVRKPSVFTRMRPMALLSSIRTRRMAPGQYVTREPMKPMRSTNFTRR